MSFSNIPNEILLSIIETLSTADLSRLSRTSHNFHHLLSPVLLSHLTVNDTANKVLRWAIWNHNLQTLKLALAHGATEHTVSEPGDCSALSLAVALRHIDIVEILLTHSNDHIASAKLGCHVTPLQNAIYQNDIHMVALLLKHGADANTGKRRAKPLGLTGMYGSAEMAELLLDAGANVGSRVGVWYETPMYMAWRSKNWPVARVLARAGAYISENRWEHGVGMTRGEILAFLEGASA